MEDVRHNERWDHKLDEGSEEMRIGKLIVGEQSIPVCVPCIRGYLYDILADLEEGELRDRFPSVKHVADELERYLDRTEGLYIFRLDELARATRDIASLIIVHPDCPQLLRALETCVYARMRMIGVEPKTRKLD